MCLFAYSGVKHVLTIRVTCRVSYLKRQEMLAFHGRQGSLPIFGGVCGVHLFSFLCCVVLLSSSCVLCTLCYQFLWIVHSRLPLRFSLTFISNRLTTSVLDEGYSETSGAHKIWYLHCFCLFVYFSFYRTLLKYIHGLTPRKHGVLNFQAMAHNLHGWYPIIISMSL